MSQKSTTTKSNSFDQVITHINSTSKSTTSKATALKHNPQSNSTRHTMKSTSPIDFTKYQSHTKTFDPYNLTEEQKEELVLPSPKANRLFPTYGLNPLKNMFTRLHFIQETKSPDADPGYEVPTAYLGSLLAELFTKDDMVIEHYVNENPIFVQFYDGSQAIFTIDEEFGDYIDEAARKGETRDEQLRILNELIDKKGLPIVNEYQCPDCTLNSDNMFFAAHDYMVNPTLYGLVIETKPEIYVVVV